MFFPRLDIGFGKSGKGIFLFVFSFAESIYGTMFNSCQFTQLSTSRECYVKLSNKLCHDIFSLMSQIPFWDEFSLNAVEYRLLKKY